jgi:hypothetical protein
VIARVLNAIGLDRAVSITLIGRVWTIFGGLGSIYFLTRFLTPELQGYYYTFGSVLALQLFVELGLTHAIIQFSSHEMAELRWTSEGVVVGESKAKRRLQSILYFATFWFSAGALLMIVLLVPLGMKFFDATSAPMDVSRANIVQSWLLLVCAASLNMVITALAAVLEGCGKVVEVATVRFFQSFFSVTAAWAVLSFGGHLYALAVSSSMMGVIGLVFLVGKHRLFFVDLFRYKVLLPGVSWRREIWPFQWRIALSWSSGFFTFHLFNPLLFASHGPIVAGQMGMSLQIISALNNVAMAWITPNVPTYGRLVATRQTLMLNTLFFRGLIQSFTFLSVSVISVLTLLLLMSFSDWPYSARVLSLSLFAILGIVCLANHVVFAEAAYLRAYKEEPFMIISILSGLTIAILAVYLIPPFGAAGAVYSYASGVLFVALAGGTAIFRKKLKAIRLD